MTARFIVNDLVYVFSLVACLELIGPLIASPIFNAFYNASLKSFLGTSFLFESGIQMIQIIFLAYAIFNYTLYVFYW